MIFFMVSTIVKVCILAGLIAIGYGIYKLGKIVVDNFGKIESLN